MAQFHLTEAQATPKHCNKPQGNLHIVIITNYHRYPQSGHAQPQAVLDTMQELEQQQRMQGSTFSLFAHEALCLYTPLPPSSLGSFGLPESQK
jgi:hypothetical protein